MSDSELLDVLHPERLRELSDRSLAKTGEDAARALSRNALGIEDFLALVSPAAKPFLEQMAQRAKKVTRERFGKVVGLYAPVYLSNECTNSCSYCGFNRHNPLKRVTLGDEEILSEADHLWNLGFRNVLLVSGEHQGIISLDYLARAAKLLHPRFPSLSVEVYPLEVEGYARLSEVGIEGVTIYQETYDPVLYETVHPQGRKRDFAYRLNTPARAGAAGMRRVGIGSLLGLGSWRYEAVALALHALWLQKNFWRTAVSVSFPRLRAAAGGFAPPHPVSDADLVQLALALRLLMPDVGLVLSTRESCAFRDGLVPICVTMMSAGSKTEPGGYLKPGDAGEQFRIEDDRTPAQVASMLYSAGLEPVWKDWDGAFTG